MKIAFQYFYIEYIIDLMRISIISKDPIFAQTMREKFFRLYPDTSISIFKEIFSVERKRKRSQVTILLISKSDFHDNDRINRSFILLQKSRSPIIFYSDSVTSAMIKRIPSHFSAAPGSLSAYEFKDHIDKLLPGSVKRDLSHFLPAATYQTALDSSLTFHHINESIKTIIDCEYNNQPKTLLEMAIPEDREILLNSRFNNPEPGIQYVITFRMYYCDKSIKLIQDRGIIQADPITGMLYSEGLLIDMDKIMSETFPKRKNFQLDRKSSSKIGYFEFIVHENQLLLDRTSAELLEMPNETNLRQLLRKSYHAIPVKERKNIYSAMSEFLDGRTPHFNCSFKYKTVTKTIDLAFQCHRLVTCRKKNQQKFIGIIQDVSDEILEIEKKQKRERDKSTQILAGGFAHDFNNRLQVIIGYTAMIQYKFKNKELEQDLWNIENAVIEASDLTNKLLSYSKRGKYLDLEVNVHSLIEKAIELSQKNYPDIHESITLQLEANEPNIKGDPKQLIDAFSSLLQNSYESNLYKKKPITIMSSNINTQTEPTAINNKNINNHACQNQPKKNEESIEIHIIDKGTGITDAIKNRIFEPYFTTKNPSIHSGLGLPSVIGTIEIHNGIIDLKSKEDEGTEVIITLPTLNQKTSISDKIKQNAIKRKPTQKTTTSLIQKEKRRIFIIDDDKSVNQITAALLESMGYSVLRAFDGQEAIGIFQSEYKSIDLVLLDMILPEMDGKAIFIQLKKIDPTVKALIISGYSKDSKAQDTIKMGAVGFVQKPLRKSDLKKAVEIYTEQ